MGSSGRKKGSVTLRTREVAERAAGEGVTPLEIMLSVMHEQSQAYRQDKTHQSAAVALAAAKDAAAYVHPRLSASDGPVRLPELTGGPAEQGRAILDALAAGRITLDRTGRVMGCIADHLRIVEIDELESRLKALEERDGA